MNINFTETLTWYIQNIHCVNENNFNGFAIKTSTVLGMKDGLTIEITPSDPLFMPYLEMTTSKMPDSASA